MSSSRLGRRASDKRTLPNGSEPSLAVVSVGESDFSTPSAQETDQNDPFCAGIRTLYGQLCFCESPLGGALRSVGVTSCYRHEGKSTVAANLAEVASESRQVLFIDANVSRPLVHRAIENALPDDGDRRDPITAVETIHGPPLVSTSPLAARKAGGHPTPEQTRDLLQTLSAEFNLLIVDLPPLDDPRSLEWAPLLDGIVLVVESERVRWQVAARGIALLEQAGGNMLGTVINKRRDYIPQWLYRRL